MRFLLAILLPVPVCWALPPGGQTPAPIDPEPCVVYKFDGSMRFGVSVRRDHEGKAADKKLIFAPDGSTNSTVVRVDGKDAAFGTAAGKWLTKSETIPADPLWEAQPGTRSVWGLGKLTFTQTLQVVPCKQPVPTAQGPAKRFLDTVLVRYRIENKDDRPHTVGLRFLLDTLIGDEDGVPFIVPGLPHLVTAKSHADFPKTGPMPDFIQALERPNLKDPGTVAQLTLKVDSRVEPPGRVSLTNWPRAHPWEIPVKDIDRDSAVVLYWNPQELKPGQSREVGFAYGLGNFASLAGKLGVTVAGSFFKGEVFSVTAFVLQPAAGQSLTLKLPPELQLAEGPEQQTLSAAKDAAAVATWKVKAQKSGSFPVEIQSSTGGGEKHTVTILPGEIVEAVAGDTFVDLSWPPPEEVKVTGYRVYRADAKEPIHGTRLLDKPAFRDLGLSNGQSYVYLVRAVLSDGSEWTGYRPVAAVPGAK